MIIYYIDDSKYSFNSKEAIIMEKHVYYLPINLEKLSELNKNYPNNISNIKEAIDDHVLKAIQTAYDSGTKEQIDRLIGSIKKDPNYATIEMSSDENVISVRSLYRVTNKNYNAIKNLNEANKAYLSSIASN